MSVDFTIRNLPPDCLCWAEVSSGPIRTSTFRTHPDCPVHVERPTDLGVVIRVRRTPEAPAEDPAPPPPRRPTPPPPAEPAFDLRAAAERIHAERGHSWALARCDSCWDRAGRQA